MSRFKKKSGFVLMIVMWLTVILSILSLGLARRTSIDQSLLKYHIGQLKARYLAFAGMVYAGHLIALDKKDEKSKAFDTLLASGVPLTHEDEPVELLKTLSFPEGEVNFIHPQGAIFSDEESRINLNGLTLQNFRILSHLIEILGFEKETAEKIAAGVVDWRDTDADVTENLGAEEPQYAADENPYHCKNRNFDHIQELMLVKNMTPEIFEALKDYVTIFPKTEGAFQVNINTAPVEVIHALAKNFSGPQTNTNLEDAESLARKVVEHRQKLEPDQVIEAKELNLNMSESTIYNAIMQYLTQTSNFYRAKIEASGASSRPLCVVEAVIYKEDLSIVSWRRL